MIQFTNLTQVKKPNQVVEPKRKKIFRYFGRKTLMFIEDHLKHVYTLVDTDTSREVLRMVSEDQKDDKAKNYIDRCYGKRECILNW